LTLWLTKESSIKNQVNLYKTAYGTEIPAMGMGGGMMGKNGSQGMMRP
jgi:hypothetical protein